jgi:hypothetical protein
MIPVWWNTWKRYAPTPKVKSLPSNIKAMSTLAKPKPLWCHLHRWKLLWKNGHKTELKTCLERRKNKQFIDSVLKDRSPQDFDDSRALPNATIRSRS